MPEGLRPGALLDGRFLLRGKLGAGSFAVVWFATDQRTGDDAAVKVLRPGLLRDRDALERFAREAALLGGLDHPNLARLIAWRVEAPEAFIAMEYVDGTTLAETISRRAAAGLEFEPEAVCRLMDEICAPIAYAHQHGVVHRDIKPSNVILENGRDSLKVLDFGIARVAQPAGQQTTVGRIIGTPAYMAPEQARGDLTDGRGDVFALGAILFQLLTLRHAWLVDESGGGLAVDRPASNTGPNGPVAVLDRITRGARPTARELRPELGPEINAVVERALASAPDDRFSTASELAASVRSALRTDVPEPVLLTDLVVSPGPPPPRSRWGRTLALAAGIVGVSAALVAGYLARDERQAESSRQVGPEVSQRAAPIRPMAKGAAGPAALVPPSPVLLRAVAGRPAAETRARADGSAGSRSPETSSAARAASGLGDRASASVDAARKARRAQPTPAAVTPPVPGPSAALSRLMEALRQAPVEGRYAAFEAVIAQVERESARLVTDQVRDGIRRCVGSARIEARYAEIATCVSELVEAQAAESLASH